MHEVVYSPTINTIGAKESNLRGELSFLCMEISFSCIKISFSCMKT